MAALRAEEEKNAAFAAGVRCRDSGDMEATGRARASAVIERLVAMVVGGGRLKVVSCRGRRRSRCGWRRNDGRTVR